MTVVTTGKVLTAYRTNYDRFEIGGIACTSAEVAALRTNGWTVKVIDRTPADCGEWVLEPLEGPVGLIG